MDYEAARQIIAEFEPDSLPLFADGWSRWPSGQRAWDCVLNLRQRSRSLKAFDVLKPAQLLWNVAAEIQDREVLASARAAREDD